jgi:hypothetical protein
MKMKKTEPVFGRLLKSTCILLAWFSVISLFPQAPTTFTSNGTFTVPAGVTEITIECWGAGGGGGSRTSSTGGTGGGGGGAYSRMKLNVAPGTQYKVVVGTGGGAGANGGDSYFYFGNVNQTHVRAAGGKGVAANTLTGGAGGSSSLGSAISSGDSYLSVQSNGYVNPGGKGGNGTTSGTYYSGGGGGAAGPDAAGGAGNGYSPGPGYSGISGNGGTGAAGLATGNQNGSLGNPFGGGGSGARRGNSTSYIGGSGANGLVRISYIKLITESTAIIGVDSTFTFVAYSPGGVWTSDATSIATVDPVTGVVRGVQPGSVNITYTLNGLSATMKVKVVHIPSINVVGSGEICTGSPINLKSSAKNVVDWYWEGPNGYYSDDATAAVATTSSATNSGKYVVFGVSEKSDLNLITNGDFSSGYVGITSDYSIGTNSANPYGHYEVLKDASLFYAPFSKCGDHTTGSDYMMVIDGSETTGTTVWSQTVPVATNTDYVFSYWLMSLYGGGGSLNNLVNIQLYINDIPVGPETNGPPIPDSSCPNSRWRQFSYVARSGNSTSLTIKFENKSTEKYGNDFALDDIEFKQVFIVSDTVDVVVLPSFTPSIDISAKNKPIYVGEPNTFSATPVHGGDSPSYTWYVNGVPQTGQTGSTFDYTPKEGDVITCSMVSSLKCATGAVSSNSLKSILKNYWYGTVDNDWAKPVNWITSQVPASGEDVEFATASNNDNNHGDGRGAAIRDLHLDQDRIIRNLINNSDKNLIVTAGKKLVINGTVQDVNSDGGTVVVKSSPDVSTGTLYFANPTANNSVNAVVEFYNQGYDCQCGFYTKKWQYFGIPVASSLFPYSSPLAETVNQWVEAYNGNKWQPAPFAPDTELKAFKGYEITNSGTAVPSVIYRFSGVLNLRDATVDLFRSSNVNYQGMNLIGNSYTAAIPISESALSSSSASWEKTIYLYNSGTRDQWRKLDGSHPTSDIQGGQYTTVPLSLAGTAGLPSLIPSMHAFMLQTDAPATLTIKYDQLTKNVAVNSKTWRSDKVDSIPLSYLVLDVIGSQTADRAWLFERVGATKKFDKGWDGLKIKQGTRSQVYVLGDVGVGDLQVATVSEVEGEVFEVVSDNSSQFLLNIAVTNDLEVRNLYLQDLSSLRYYSVKNGAEYLLPVSETNSRRFKVVSGSDRDTQSDRDLIFVDVSSGVIVVKNLSQEDCIGYVYDTVGNLQIRYYLPAASTSTISGSDSLSQGVYILKLLGQTSVNKTHRILLRR